MVRGHPPGALRDPLAPSGHPTCFMKLRSDGFSGGGSSRSRGLSCSWMASSLGLASMPAVLALAAVLATTGAATAEEGDDGIVQIGFRDGAGKDLDPNREHASLERTPPERAPASADARYDDPDALRLTVAVSASAAPAPPSLSVESIAASGTKIDRIPEIPLAPAACAPGVAPSTPCF